jgi:predicted AAA+ superfamily ATPase
MLAHNQGGLLNAAQLARSLAVSGRTVAHYLDLMVDLLLVRRLPPLPGGERYRLGPSTEAISLVELCAEVKARVE